MEKVLDGKKVWAGVDGLLTSPGTKKIGKNYEDYSCVCVCVVGKVTENILIQMCRGLCEVSFSLLFLRIKV